ncbi:MAG: hypothetical protein CBD18_02460 [Opitutales bacterium TMED158]|mgnify:CR=1 FL=1|nr:MAG: hypothetical protein CBD18_02460 [Opitutales bacterium TMED158]|tara:strand:+ start:842 stop:1078 length:237 start_codon:yes stop_codon:yes gene_type:complete
MNRTLYQAWQDFPRYYRPLMSFFESQVVNAAIDSPWFTTLDDSAKRKLVNELAAIDKEFTKFQKDWAKAVTTILDSTK